MWCDAMVVVVAVHAEGAELRGCAQDPHADPL